MYLRRASNQTGHLQSISDVLMRESERRGPGREPALEKRQPAVSRPFCLALRTMRLSSRDLCKAELTSVKSPSSSSFPGFYQVIIKTFVSPLHSSPSTCIPFVLEAWQLPQIKRTTCLECVHSSFPTLPRSEWASERSCPDSASYTPREQSKIVTIGITCWLLTGYYVPCFELPRKPLTFMEGILQQRLLQNSYSCENEPDAHARDSRSSALFLPGIYGRSWASTDWPRMKRNRELGCSSNEFSEHARSVSCIMSLACLPAFW